MSRNMLLSYLLQAVHAGDGVADAELLRRFAADRDEAAFELLVRRHADAVWKVCRSVTRQHADAEDAFQATFLALARRAGAVRGAAAGFLHRVAVHAALKARAKADRAGLPLADDVPAPTDDRVDVSPIHEEVARLPDRYRLPVVLCDLEGRTHAEAAAELGWPVGTVSGRLSRARHQLRKRLERRGVAGAAVVGTDRLTAGADLIRAAVLVGVGGRPVPVAVASLTTGVLAAMHTSKVLTAVAVIGVGIAGTCTAWVLAQDKGPGQPAPTPAVNVADKPPAPPADEKWPPPSDFPNIPRLPDPEWRIAGLMPKVLPTDTPAVRNRKRVLLAAHGEIVLYARVFKSGHVRPGDVEFLARTLTASRAVAAAAAELWDKPDELRPWLEWRVAVAKDHEQMILEWKGRGALSLLQDVTAVRDRLDAEFALMLVGKQSGR